jgi:hypothetical protein
MSQEIQTYANHVRRHPPFHFVLLPIVSLHFLYTAYRRYRMPDVAHAEALLLAFGLIVVALLTRINALRVQDRVIRLEEELRYQRLLPAELAEQARQLPVRFVVALRFASDEELPALVREVLAGKFAKPDEVKRAIKNWRADTLRV